MMPFSVGTDIVEVGRIRDSAGRERFLKRVYSPVELELLMARREPWEGLAANWAAKEAFAKCLGTGVRGFELTEVEILRDELGAPYYRLSGKALEKAAGLELAVSLSHTREYAVATAIAYRKEP